MSLERIRAQLEKFGLAKPDDEMSVTMMPVGPFLLLAIRPEIICLSQEKTM